ncbi:MAG: hypothetical protein NT062_38765, partial [Proteobacteria bacterium]|nr:hypothetical protein [Pseudomonadota bacterium]
SNYNYLPRPAVVAARSTSGIKPTQLKVTKLSSGNVHRVAIFDDVEGRPVALGVGSSCFATSDGKKFHRRASATGTAYGVFAVDGVVFAMGGAFAASSDVGASWRSPKPPYSGNLFTMFRDSTGLYWLGCDQGKVFTSERPDRGWRPAKFSLPGKVMAFAEIDGKIFVVGAGCGVWNGTKFAPLKGTTKKQVITRIAVGPSGGLALVGDGGVAYRSKDGGKSFTKVKSGVTCDLEDLAWVAGSLFAVGGDWNEGVVIRSDDEGASWKRAPFKVADKLWGIASWGDGAFLGGEGGLYTMKAAGDPYWRGAEDRFEPEPPKVDPEFTPHAARSGKSREADFTRLFAAAVATHAKLPRPRISHPLDANAKLAAAVDEGVEGAEVVYSDWLQESGDPRGELAQVQIHLAHQPKDKELKKAERALLKKHAEALLGKLADVDDLIELEWTAGFITKARLAMTYARDEEFGDADDDDEKVESIKLEKVLGWLLASPSARFLRELTIGIVQFVDNTYAGIAKELGKHQLPALRSLFLGDFTYEETELNWSDLGNVEPIYAAVPNLEKLVLRSGSMKLGTIVLPHLEHFEVITGGMDAKAARAIAAAVWPSLEKLSIQIGPESDGASPKVKDLQPILDGGTLPRLTHLGIANFNETDQLVEVLASSKLLPQLAELDLSMGTLADEHVAKLFARQKAFAHLTKIDVHDNYLTNASRTLLAKANLVVNFGKQREDDGDDRVASAYE